MRHRPALHEAAHVLAAHQRDVLAEAGDVQVEELAAVLALLGRHVVEHPRAVGVVAPQVLGEVGVDAAVLLLGADG